MIFTDLLIMILGVRSPSLDLLDSMNSSFNTTGKFVSHDVLASAVHILKLERYRED